MNVVTPALGPIIPIKAASIASAIPKAQSPPSAILIPELVAVSKASKVPNVTDAAEAITTFPIAGLVIVTSVAPSPLNVTRAPVPAIRLEAANAKPWWKAKNVPLVVQEPLAFRMNMPKDVFDAFALEEPKSVIKPTMFGPK